VFTEIEVEEPTGAVATVLVRGELDLASAADLRAAIATAAAAQPQRLVIDLSAVTFVDSSGLGAIAGGLRAQRPHAGSLEVRGAKPGVRRIFEVAGLKALLAD
jgi:anti-anti-sigma factor